MQDYLRLFSTDTVRIQAKGGALLTDLAQGRDGFSQSDFRSEQVLC